ncbi:MAG: Holliday junction resolvase RecU [Lachnospiraceae bacterium]|nr:Holliday junction resolvase RecU [Lachnospiraceae bacterium]
MATWNTRGLRGSTLEEMINFSLARYREKHLALIQKIPTPIKPIDIDKESRHITLAYFDQKSTVDYIGVVQGVPVCFDAKECAADTIPLQNIHEHQIRFMNDFEEQGGVAFILLYLTHRDECFYIPLRELEIFWNRAAEGGRKSFTYAELSRCYPVHSVRGLPLHFLEALQRDLAERD